MNSDYPKHNRPEPPSSMSILFQKARLIRKFFIFEVWYFMSETGRQAGRQANGAMTDFD